MMAHYVLDASALLALLKREMGSEKVVLAITEGSAMSTVNLSEVVAKLSEGGMPDDAIHESLDSLELDVIDFDVKQAYRAGLLRTLTKRVGLSLGDRACLALAQQLNLPTLTTDRAWKDVVPGISVQTLR